MNEQLARRYEIAKRIFRLNRLHQRRSKFIGTAYRSELTLLEVYTLMEMAREPTLSIGEISTLLISARGAVTRAVARLARGRYIRKERATQDRRAARFEVLAKGKDFLALQDRESREFLKTFLSHLSPREVGVLKESQRIACDSVSAPLVFLRPGEHPFEEGVRRITRAMGFIGPSLCGSGYSSTTWQILSTIHDHSEAITISELSDTLSMHVATLSQTVERYDKLGWVKRAKSTRDGRLRVLSLKKKGLEVLDAINQAGADFWVKAYRDQSLEEMQEVLDTFAKLHAPPQSIELSTLRPALSIEEPLAPERRDEARGFIIMHRYRLGWLTNIPDTLVNATNRTFTLVEGTRILAALECREVDGRFEVLHLCYSELFDTRQLLEAFLERVLQLLRPDDADAALVIEERCLGGIVPERLVIDVVDLTRRSLRRPRAQGWDQ
jgi:DNA-binding MarR family transcriptional regulator